MQLSKRSRVVLGATALSLVATSAFAGDPAPLPECTKAPTSDDVETAKQSHIIATSRFNLQDWDKAIEFWRQAYGFDCTAHAILVNIGNAYEKKGDKKSAIAMLELYLQRAIQAPDLVKVNERVVEMKQSLEPAPVPTATVTATATVKVIPTVVPPQPSVRPYGPVPLIIAGIGGALAIAGAVMIPVGSGQYNDVLKQCPNNNCQNTSDPEGLKATGDAGLLTWNLGGVFLGVGLAAAAGGAGFHFLFNQPKPVTAAPVPATVPGAAPASSGAPSSVPATAPPPVAKGRVDVVPVVSPQFGGLLFTGKF